jgi:ubiquinol-cytochrome c reductase cytochrome c subunit
VNVHLWVLSKVGWYVAPFVAATLIFSWQVAHAQETAKNPPAETASVNAENGKKLYISYGCYECHGREGQGSPYSGARLAPKPVELRYFIGYVRQPTGQMPPYTTKVASDADLADIRAFLNTVPPPPPVKSVPQLK